MHAWRALQNKINHSCWEEFSKIQSWCSCWISASLQAIATCALSCLASGLLLNWKTPQRREKARASQRYKLRCSTGTLGTGPSKSPDSTNVPLIASIPVTKLTNSMNLSSEYSVRLYLYRGFEL